MKTIRLFLSEIFKFLEVKFSMYLNRRVFVMSNYVDAQADSVPHCTHVLNIYFRLVRLKQMCLTVCDPKAINVTLRQQIGEKVTARLTHWSSGYMYRSIVNYISGRLSVNVNSQCVLFVGCA